MYDNVLTSEAIGELLAFCRESHVFYKSRDGYLLGDENGGYGSDALLRVAEELVVPPPSVVTVCSGFSWDSEGAEAETDDGPQI